MSEFTATFGSLKRGLRITAGEPHAVKVLKTSRVRLIGLFFDLNKCFLLPSALPAIRIVKNQYDKHPNSSVLVVGHTDTSGSAQYNETLSLERAKAVAAYLTDDVSAWEAFFADSKPDEKRWGMVEIQNMLHELPEEDNSFYSGEINGKDNDETKAAVRAFQEARGLKVDGIAGPETRKALIEDYMDIDGTSLPEGSTLTTHGCGENFPAEKTGDGKRNDDNRRVEVFFFDGPITPQPTGTISKKGSKEYPRWLDQVFHTFDLQTGLEVSEALRLRVHFNGAEIDEVKDKLRLFGDSGFDKVLPFPKSSQPDADFADIVFRNVPVVGDYSLEVQRAEGDNYFVFQDLPFAAMEIDPDESQPSNTDDPLLLEPEDDA